MVGSRRGYFPTEPDKRRGKWRGYDVGRVFNELINGGELRAGAGGPGNPRL
jgi:hypothetical protein